MPGFPGQHSGLKGDPAMHPKNDETQACRPAHLVDSGIGTSGESKVASGFQEALRLSLHSERENQWIAREAAIGFVQLEAGQTVEVDSEQHFIDLVRVL